MKISFPTFRKYVTLHHQTKERGSVLIVSLLVLVVMSIMTVSMFRNFNQQERIAGNTREKQRAFYAAQSALKYAEWWLAQGNGSPGTACTTLLDANAITPTTQVCSERLVSAAINTVPWLSAGSEIGVQFTPSTMNVSGTDQVNSYVSRPRFHISPLGLDPSGQSILYEVTAWSYGGNQNAVSVVQSVYAVKTGIINAGGL